MSLTDQVKSICKRLAPHGWHDLLSEHGLDINAENLEQELLRDQNFRKVIVDIKERNTFFSGSGSLTVA